MKPGPIVYGPKGEQIADCRSISNSDKENKQHARLIASAPNLLQTLDSVDRGLADLEEIVERITKDMGTRNLIREKRDWIKAAIEDAGGLD